MAVVFIFDSDDFNDFYLVLAAIRVTVYFLSSIFQRQSLGSTLRSY